MGLGEIADRLTRGVENVQDGISEALFEPVIRLGVTGLARSGKTVFITSLVANLLDRGRMAALTAQAGGRIETVYLQPQPDDTVARFDFEGHMAALSGPTPHWPESTRTISELRLSFKVRPSGLLGAVSGSRTVHLDIVDYPGEWLLDLRLLPLSYAEWATETLDRIATRESAASYMAALGDVDPNAKLDEVTARDLADRFTNYLNAASAAGYSDCTPGRFLLPGDLAGSPVLTFAPLPRPDRPDRASLWREMERRFEAYKSKVVKPFFRDHFAKIDRQVVLVDVLGAVHAGPQPLDDLRRTLADVMSAFRPGRASILARLLGGKRVERILFAATKADHLHHTQHPQLTGLAEALLREAKDRADYAGARSEAMAIASLRSTVEELLSHDGSQLPAVRGRLAGGKQAGFYPGELPSDPAQLLAPARKGADAWLDADFANMAFEPPLLDLKRGDGPPHIRLDRAAEFLFGDKL